MPIFEYLCRRCDKTIEMIQRNAPESVACSQCGGPAERVVSVFSGKAADGSGGGSGCAPAGGFG